MTGPGDLPRHVAPVDEGVIEDDVLLDEAARQAVHEADIRDLAGGAIVVLLGKMARASRGAFLWIITIMMGADVLGLYSLAWAVCTILNKVARFGLPRGIVFFINHARADGIGDTETRQDESLAAGSVLALLASGLVVVAVWVSADAVAGFYDLPIAAALRVMVLTAPFVALAWIFTSATRALRIMRYEVYVWSICGPALLFVGGVAVGFAGFGLDGVTWVQFGMSVGCFLFALRLFRRHFSIGGVLGAFRRRLPLGPVARFSTPVMLTDLLYALLTQLDVLMLGFFVDIRLVGIYVLARRVASIVLKAPQAFDAIFSSIVSELSARQRHSELGDRFVVISRWILTINLPIFACLLLIGEPILQSLGDQKLAGGSDLELGLRILFILCIGMLVQSVFAVAEPLLAMTGRPGLNLANNIFWLVGNFSLNLWLIRRYGLVGAAISATLTMVLVNALRMTQVYLLRRILPFRRSQLKPLVAALIAAVPAIWLRSEPGSLWMRLLVPATGYVLVYTGCLVLLRPEAEDRMLLHRLLQRVRRMRSDT